jgi:hypothetical protein
LIHINAILALLCIKAHSVFISGGCFSLDNYLRHKIVEGARKAAAITQEVERQDI